MISRLLRSLCIGIACIAWAVACSALYAHAGNIFDDDWTPPKPVGQQHAAPAKIPPAVSIPVPSATGQVPAVSPSPSRHAIPDKSDQARSRGLLRAAFAEKLKDRSIAGRKKLAHALLDEAPKTADNPSDQYVLLGGAIEASKDAGILQLCFQAADTMAVQYEVDGLNVKTEAALKVNLRGESPASAREERESRIGIDRSLARCRRLSHCYKDTRIGAVWRWRTIPDCRRLSKTHSDC